MIFFLKRVSSCLIRAWASLDQIKALIGLKPAEARASFDQNGWRSRRLVFRTTLASPGNRSGRRNFRQDLTQCDPQRSGSSFFLLQILNINWWSSSEKNFYQNHKSLPLHSFAFFVISREKNDVYRLLSNTSPLNHNFINQYKSNVF